MRIFKHAIRWLPRAALGSLAGIALTCSASAYAGTVQITSCGDAPSGGADTAWQVVNDDPGGYDAPASVCPPTGAAVGTDLDHTQILGLSLWTHLNNTDPSVIPQSGQRAQMRFTAPSGTTISAVNIRRDIGLRSDGYSVYGRTDSGQLPGETCVRPGGQWGCVVGGYSAGYTPLSGLDASYIAWGFECGANGFTTCSTGTTLHQAWVHIYASTVTLTDNQVPTGVTAGGDVTTPGWKRGSVAGSVSGTDNLGVKNLRWYADGALVSTSSDRDCDYSTTVPCSDASNVGYALDTSGLADGTRHIQAAVVDPAGNETRGSQFDVQVDNTPPRAPTGLNVTGGGTSTAITMAFSSPAADSGSPYVGSRWQACAGATCSSGTGTLTGATGNLPNATGSYAVKVWLVDGAGNADVATAATDSMSYTAPTTGGGGGGGGGGTAPSPTTPTQPTVPGDPTPQAPPLIPGPIATPPPAPAPTPRAEAAIRLATPRLNRRSGKLTLHGTLARGASGSVSITVTTKGHRQRTTVRIRRGRYATTIRLPKGTTRARVTVRYGGSATTRPGRTTRTISAG